MGKVVIMRAVPGSGKSTYIKNNLKDAAVCSADHFFTTPDGRYEFDIKKIGQAHAACKQKFTDALHRGDPLIVVDNTNIKVRDFRHYIIEAKAKGYDVEVVHLSCDPEVAAKRNVHRVPKDVVMRMHTDLLAAKLPDDLQEIVCQTFVKTDEPEMQKHGPDVMSREVDCGETCA